MSAKKCIVCGEMFDAQGNAKSCSAKCMADRRVESNRVYRRKYHAANQEKEWEYDRMYRLANQEKILDYRVANREKFLEYQRKYRQRKRALKAIMGLSNLRSYINDSIAK